ncbi:hypothetical protein SOV_22610 [Sporomusa ovata DSM 2662]|uniref:Uncharacterized protein n=1 Tax=Sporomusa ovata TaxID=2378 RepID=A0A0U1L5F3_9FIRM|nr:hypothetical protein [Sporomusa ovata]EQB25577.1 hypothetical protein SOV_4c02400 [Sporomusa ovata DSM 2662]CQR74134.1 hypothetical protein SpAn4DRAFT_0596 [Sporomusa ovata]
MSEVAVLHSQGTNDGALVDMNGMGSGEMAARLADMETKLDLVQKFFKRVMKKDEDYGIIPGTDKPSLLKPGAEKLNELYGYAPLIKEKHETRDFKTGYYLAEVVVQIVHRSSGLIISEGVGEASSYESKYRYRWVFESDLPKGIDKDSLISKTFESKKTGKEYTRYRLENPDLIDQWNTVLKMAKKRALVDATLSATRTSGIFSQSEDEMEAWLEGESGEVVKDKLEKQRSNPQASDERVSFQPPPSNGGRISDKQYGKIVGDAKRKGVDEDSIKNIILYVKKKPINELSTAEASAVIKFIADTDEDGLQDLILQAAIPGVVS